LAADFSTSAWEAPELSVILQLDPNRLIMDVSAVIKERQLRQELSTLEQRLSLLDRQLADALHRIHHSKSADLIEKAAQDEKAYLAQLDRLMTRMRAIEGQLLQINKLATRH
jgi:uncharacterized protein (DUF342 family)